MKCLILAGGSGDRLWPLSRKNYPKQFMEINNNRSLLQETVVRNLPFCDEFYISTNSAYHFIVENQMKAFQGLTYRCFLEEIPRGTAAAVALICMLANPSEPILVVSADTLAGDENYQEAVLMAKALASDGKMVAFGTVGCKLMSSCGYMEHEGIKVSRFHIGIDEQVQAMQLAKEPILMHTGMSMFQAGVFLRRLRKDSYDLFCGCVKIARTYRKGMDTVLWKKELLETLPLYTLEKAVFKNNEDLVCVEGRFSWNNIDSYEDLKTDVERVINSNSKNTHVINNTRNHLVALNEVNNVVVVHTNDVTYIGKADAGEDIKAFIYKYSKEYPEYFNDSNVVFHPYGTQEILVRGKNYVVKKTVIYPGYSMNMHSHSRRKEQWTVIEGEAVVTLCDRTFVCHTGDGVSIDEDERHSVENLSEGQLTIIRTITGYIESKEAVSEEQEGKRGIIDTPNIVKLKPALKDYLWGGCRIKKEMGKKTDMSRIAESWELSAHEDGQSIVASGRYRGVRFGKYLNMIGREAWGWKAASMPRFPILIKFLDSEAPLSLQVHPDDEYALSHENEYGKYEMWYILKASADAFIYQGFNRSITSDEIMERIDNSTIMEVLNKCPVHEGDVIFIEPGCVHAMGSGIMACEIQQNSNTTYRLYDYNRCDAYMNKRTLHISKALDILKTESKNDTVASDKKEKVYEGYKVRELGSCKYFASSLYIVKTTAKIEIDDSSFVSLLVTEGQGKISDDSISLDFNKGDSFFLKAGKYNVNIEGSSQFIITHV